MRTLVMAGVLVVASAGMSAAQDVAAGEQVFKRLCSPCHDIGEDAKVKLGPPLNGIDGRKSGSFEGFNYSEANKKSGITWDEATFSEYIKDPRAKIPGTKMVYAGLKDDQRVKDIIAFLKQYDASGKKAQ